MRRKFALIQKSGRGSRWCGDQEHDRSDAGLEGYVAICAGCKGGERDETCYLRPPCCTVLSHVSRSMD